MTAPVAIAAALQPYLADPEHARAAGEAGRRFVTENFAPDVVSARLWSALRAQAGDSSS